MTLGVWMPLARDRSPRAPELSPMGRALLACAAEGIDVILGERAEDGQLVGHRAEPGRWVPAKSAIDAAYDRFRSVTLPERYAALRAALPDVPVANPPALIALCWDKLACQRHLEARGVRMPEVAHGGAIHDAIARWGLAFVKPRTGAFGEGVYRVDRDTILPVGELVAQRAIAPPHGYAGVSVRALVQRDPDWVVNPLVVRRSTKDPVVNAMRGAEVVPEGALPRATREAVVAEAAAVARALADHPEGALLAEVGVDLVIDPDGRPWVIEANGRPRGRLEVLALRDPAHFEAAHVAACARPLRFLAARVRASGA